MKKTLPLILCLLLLCACGGGGQFVSADASLEDISAELRLLYPGSDVTRLNQEYMLLLYGLDSESCAECAAFRISRAITPGEVILVHARDEASLSEIQETLETYLTQLRDTTREYDAESYAIAEKSRVLTRGLYALLICDERQEELEELFLDHMKEYTPGQEPVFTPAPAELKATEPPAEVEESPAVEIAAAEETVPVPYGLVPEGPRVADSWFDDVLLVGNSVLGNLKSYVISRRMGEEPGCMGKAKFMNVNTLSYATAIGEIHSQAILPHMDGLGNCTVEEAVSHTGAKKVMLTMGYGDLIYYPGDYERTVKNCAKLVESIREQCGEDMMIYIVSVTPRTSNYSTALGNQKEIDALNAALLAWCEEQENRCRFVNAAEVLKDEKGYLRRDYCSDASKEGIHHTVEASQVWLDYLYTHTAN